MTTCRSWTSHFSLSLSLSAQTRKVAGVQRDAAPGWEGLAPPGPGFRPAAEICRDYCRRPNILWRPGRGRGVRGGGGARMSAVAPVKHAAAVSYRLDIHDHCRRCQSVYGHVQRGLGSESLCSVSADGFLGEITFFFHSFRATQPLFCAVVLCGHVTC